MQELGLQLSISEPYSFLSTLNLMQRLLWTQYIKWKCAGQHSSDSYRLWV